MIDVPSPSDYPPLTPEDNQWLDANLDDWTDWHNKGRNVNNARNINEVRVSKNQLVSIIEQNMLTHRDEFLEAMEGYRTEAIRLLEEHIDRIKNNAPEKVFVSLPMPSDHTDEYEVILSMLGMSLDDEILLSEYEYTRYVLDQWEWKKDFTTTAAMYTGKG